MSNCNCPLPTHLEDIGAQGCPFNVGQIQRVIITRASNSTFPLTIASADPAVLATWTPLLTAADDTKVVKTPLVGGNPAIVGGSAITQGGNDNSTLNGEVEVTGTESSVFTADFKDLEPAIARAIKLLKCESVKVFFVNDAGDIIGLQNKVNPATITTFDGVTVNGKSFFLSDRNNSGFGQKDVNTLSFNLAPGWDDYLMKVTPTDFNALTF